MRERREIPHLSGAQIAVHGQVGEGNDTVSAVAARQHGIVARRQLLNLGMSDRSIQRGLVAGRLHRLFPGVYSVGYEQTSSLARVLAAVMSCAPLAAASHHSAAFVWGLAPPRPGVVHVTCPERRVSRAGVAIHRAKLPGRELARVEGIPVTSLSRTFLDLSESMAPGQLRRLVKDAEFRGLIRTPELAQILDRYPRRRGRRSLATLLAPLLAHGGQTRSSLEDEFLDFCAARRIPLPETNVPITIDGRRYELDCVWPDARLIVELDGRAAHIRELAFEEDRSRDRRLIAAGWLPMRVTSGHLRAHPDQVEADILSTIRRSKATDGRSPT